jgi:hypothetical protein
MAIAAIAHAFVFGVEPYKRISSSAHGEFSHQESKMEVKVDVNFGGNGMPTTVEQKETHVKTPGTSIRESVQDVVLGGGHHVKLLTSIRISVGGRSLDSGFFF